MDEKQFLTGEWSFQEAGTNEWLKGQVPGCVQLDLINLGEMPDPFYRNNENQFYAIEDKEWVYQKQFIVERDRLAAHQINLVFEGIDTVAYVYLNDQLIGEPNNMFIKHTISVKSYLQKGVNTLTLRFPPITEYLQALRATSPFPIHTSIEPGRPFVRKAQYSFGWDWGPRLAQIGIWRPVYLEFIEEAALEDVFVYTDQISSDEALLHVEGYLTSWNENQPHVIIEVMHENKPVSLKTATLWPDVERQKFVAKISIPQPKLWYPAGLGDQPLYQVVVKAKLGQREVERKIITTGIRVVKLIQDKDEVGTSFIFEINGKKIFAKGADWIPGDNFLPRFSSQDYQQYIDLAVEANMNMLRIWGGGIYEDPAFYQACDQKGIMVWQDFMYACSEYPDRLDWFKESAQTEAEAVVKALRNHPSIVLWCGNNEINWLYTEGLKDNGHQGIYGNELFQQILPEVCLKNDPSRPYWVSSPYGREEDPNGMDEGNRHNWLVWSNWQDYGKYHEDTSRFISEFGFQAMPTWSTVKEFTAKQDRHILSPIMLGHQKMVEGTERLIRFMVGRLGFPKDFLSFVYLTQFNQAEAIKVAVEHWRSRKYRTAGALYWQFNDCWPGASWSSIDYYQGKKGLYYYTKRFFADVLPVIECQDNQIIVKIISDRQQPIDGQVEVSAYSLAGKLKAKDRFQVRVTPDGVGQAAQYGLTELGIGYQPVILHQDHVATTLQQEVNGELLDTVVFVRVTAEGNEYINYKVFDRFRHLNLSKPQFTVSEKQGKILLTADRPAFGVFIHSEQAANLSDNCLWMIPGKEYLIDGNISAKSAEILDLTQMIQQIY